MGYLFWCFKTLCKASDISCFFAKVHLRGFTKRLTNRHEYIYPKDGTKHNLFITPSVNGSFLKFLKHTIHKKIQNMCGGGATVGRTAVLKTIFCSHKLLLTSFYQPTNHTQPAISHCSLVWFDHWFAAVYVCAVLHNQTKQWVSEENSCSTSWVECRFNLDDNFINNSMIWHWSLPFYLICDYSNFEIFKTVCSKVLCVYLLLLSQRINGTTDVDLLVHFNSSSYDT